jgi:thioredoxin:protein disulfide reductase
MRFSRIAFLLVGFTLAAGLATAKPWWMRGIESNEADFLPPDVAFHVMAANEGKTLRIRWVLADGYYLYAHKMDIKAESPDLVLSVPVYPRGIVKTDAYFGSQEIYRQQVEVTVPYSRIDAGAHPLQIKVTYQGCADAGLCYPPITKVIFPAGGGNSAGTAAVAMPLDISPRPWQRIAIVGGGIAFLLAGLLLRKGRKLDLPAA